MKKLTRKQIDEFNNEVMEILEFYNAQKDHSNDIYTGESYCLNSDKVGKLGIKLDTDISSCYTIYTKFKDAEKAIQYFNVKLYNTKMNIHTYNKEEALCFIDALLDNYHRINGVNYHEWLDLVI